MRRLLLMLLTVSFPVTVMADGVLVSPPTPEIPFVPSEFVFPTYEQVVEIVFSDEASAQRAIVTVAPLYDGYERAVSCRWDDNIFENLPVKEVLDKYGTKATWYLNANDIFYLNGQDYRPMARELLEGGNSIGSHTLSHPYITYQSRNRMFEELAGVRIEWEAELDTPVVSHAFSFIDYRNGHDGDQAHADVLRSLQRAGLYHLAEFRNMVDELPSTMIYSIIMPPENQTFDTFRRAVNWAVADEVCAELFPLISHSMHGWYGTPAVEYGLDELERRVAYLASFANFWQTNQNAYAAYRYQYENTRLSVQRDANILRITMTRPRARFLNDDIPLTLWVHDVSADQVHRVMSDGSTIRASERLADRLLFNVPHASAEQAPQRIGRIENRDNSVNALPQHEDSDFLGLIGLLHWDGHAHVTLNNASGHALEDVTLTWRLPLQWQPGVIVEDLAPLRPGDSLSRTLPAIERSSDPALTSGSAYMVAQLDFWFDDVPSRLYLTLHLPDPTDTSFPRDGFTIMGPFPPSVLTVDQVDALFLQHGQPLGAVSIGENMHAAPTASRPLARFDLGWLHPEIVPVQADWYLIHSPIHILQGVIDSPRTQPFVIQCYPDDVRSVWVNGERLADAPGQFREGLNHVGLVYFHEGISTPARHNGAFLRFVNPDTMTRLADIRFINAKSSLQLNDGHTP